MFFENLNYFIIFTLIDCVCKDIIYFLIYFIFSILCWNLEAETSYKIRNINAHF
jgi:hypothetical protein